MNLPENKTLKSYIGKRVYYIANNNDIRVAQIDRFIVHTHTIVVLLDIINNQEVFIEPKHIFSKREDVLEAMIKKLNEHIDKINSVCDKETKPELDGAYSLVLHTVGTGKLHIVKIIKQETGHGLKEAKALVDMADATGNGKVIVENRKWNEVKAFAKRLEEADCRVFIMEGSESFPVYTTPGFI